MTQLTVTGVRFKRNKNSKPEKGIMLNSDKLIIDKNCKPVTKNVWSYSLMPLSDGHIIFNLCPPDHTTI